MGLYYVAVGLHNVAVELASLNCCTCTANIQVSRCAQCSLVFCEMLSHEFNLCVQLEENCDILTFASVNMEVHLALNLENIEEKFKLYDSNFKKLSS